MYAINQSVYGTVGVAEGARLPQYSSIGSQTILYVTKRNDCLCAVCAGKHRDYSNPVVAAGLFEEGDTLQCEECNEDIESSYGPVSA